jgi:Xaa-Pro aminopeptidase
LNASAYIAEPGANSQYYANISSSHWHLSERPLLLIITPEIVGEHGDVRPKVSLLTPMFEAARAKLLPIPAEHVTFAEWAEDANPYKVASSLISSVAGTVFVDGSIRQFIVDGLQTALPKSNVVSAPVEVRRLRERKSPAEIDLLKCANEASDLHRNHFTP